MQFFIVCVDSGTHGIVIEGMGRGNIPPKMVPGVEYAIGMNIPVVLVSSHYYNKEFVHYLKENHRLIDILLRLAEESSIVLLSGGGFRGPEWSIRISLANLEDESYSEIGRVIRRILEEYAAEWKKSM